MYNNETLRERVDFLEDELAELRHYLAAPVSTKEQTELYDQLVHELSSESEKEEILAVLESMEQATKRIGSEEKELVSQFRALLEKTSVTKRSLGKIRNLLGKTIFYPVCLDKWKDFSPL